MTDGVKEATQNQLAVAPGRLEIDAHWQRKSCRGLDREAIVAASTENLNLTGAARRLLAPDLAGLVVGPFNLVGNAVDAYREVAAFVEHSDNERRDIGGQQVTGFQRFE